MLNLIIPSIIMFSIHIDKFNDLIILIDNIKLIVLVLLVVLIVLVLLVVVIRIINLK